MVNITRFPVGMLTIYRILLTARKSTSHLYPTLLGPQGQPRYQILWILPIEKTWVVLFWSVHNYSFFFSHLNTNFACFFPHICLNLWRIWTLSFHFSQYHDVQLKLCGGGRWELTKLKGGNGSLNLREEATWLLTNVPERKRQCGRRSRKTLLSY